MILIVTIGGSPDPIKTSIEELNPSHVAFLCSNQSCEKLERSSDYQKVRELPGVSLEHDWIEVTEDCDHLDSCFEAATRLVKRLKQEHPDHELKLDYTGGTKSMAAAAVMVGTRFGIDLFVTTSANADRDQAKPVKAGQTTIAAGSKKLACLDALEFEFPVLFKAGEYRAITASITRILKTETDPAISRRLQRLRGLCSGLYAWDNFEYQNAYKELRSFLKVEKFKSAALNLKKIIWCIRELSSEDPDPDAIKGNGYEVVRDVLANAKRRYQTERFDDAVSRLYRAVELLAQCRLRYAHGIDPGACPFDRLPDKMKPHFKGQDTIKLALQNCYEFLSEMPDDPLGRLYLNWKSKIIGALTARNDSFLAHGLKPIGQKQYDETIKCVEPFIEEGLKALGVQFDNSDEWPSEFDGLLD